MNPGARHTMSLDGKWRTIVDPYENGHYDYRLQPSRDGYFRNAKPKDKSELFEYDFDSSATLRGQSGTSDAADSLFRRGKLRSYRLFEWREAGIAHGRVYSVCVRVTGKIKPKDNFVVQRHEVVMDICLRHFDQRHAARQPAVITGIAEHHRGLGEAEWRAGGATGNSQHPGGQCPRYSPDGRNGSAALQFPAKLTLWSPDRPKLTWRSRPRPTVCMKRSAFAPSKCAGPRSC